ncbi:MAG: hypothetical protein HDR33_03790 [Treponema sp.]|nr:hypothetical protein [Treponema sp.]MBD5440129.1 hypothetical protein [Treponema sp.]
MKYTLENSIALAVKILENNTGYILNRNIIDRIFEMTRKEHFKEKEDITMRLSVVDSFYSTNMNQRIFGFSDLADEIHHIGDDSAIIEEVEKYKKSKNSKIDDILEKEYGIRKSGKPAGKARSLITKYLYFVTKHNFPIEDNLIKNNINNVLSYFDKEIFSGDILRDLIGFCTAENLDFSEFDNFMWLLGKVNKGSFSLILKKNAYEGIVNTLGIKGEKSSDFDKNFANSIRDVKNISKIKEYISEDIFNFLMLNIDIMDETEKNATHTLL